MMRFPNGPECPKCLAKAPRQHWLKTQKRWQCRDCGKQYSVKVNTVFEDSAIKLDKWLTAMWLLANCKNGISSYEGPGYWTYATTYTAIAIAEMEGALVTDCGLSASAGFDRNDSLL
jgi:hypothetical protein